MLLLMLVGSAYLVQTQWDRDIAASREAGERQLTLLASLVRHDLQLGNYQHAITLLQEWGQNRHDVVALHLEADNGFLLGEYRRDTPAAEPMELATDIQYGYTGAARLALEIDLAPLRGHIGSLGTQLGVAYLVLAALLIALTRTLLLHSREAGELRQRSIDLNEANAQLRQTMRQREIAEEGRQRLASILEATPDLVSMSDPQGNIIYLNQAGRRLLGIGDRPLTELHIPDLHPDWAGKLIQNHGIPTAIRNGAWSGEIAILGPAGGQIPCSQVILSHRNADGGLAYLSTIIRDISERKAAEAEQQKLASLVEMSRDFIGMANMAGEVIFLNQAGCHMVGLGSPVEARRMKIFDFFPEDALRQARDEMYPHLMHQGYWFAESRFRHQRTGASIDVELSAFMIRDAQGKPLCLATVTRDITDRKQAEATLRASETRLKEAQRIAHIGSWELDLTDNQLTWSDEIYRIFELDPNRFGASYEAFLEAIHPDDRDRVNQAYSDALAARIPYDITHRLRMTDGRIKYVRERCENEYDAQGNPVRSLGTVQDVTELQEAEQQLRAYQEELETLVAERTSQVQDQAAIIDQIHDAVVSTSLEGYITGWNRGAERMFGYTQAEAIGQHIGMLYFDPDLLLQQVVTPLQQKGVHDVEVTMRRKDGSPFEGHLSLSMRQDRQGKPYGMIGYTMDITKRKRAEQLLARRSEELEATNRELEAFSYSVSHDLRAPLRAIDGFSQAIVEDYGGRLDETGRNYLDRVRTATQRMGRLIDDLLNLSRVTRAPMQPAHLDLSGMASEILAQLGEAHPERQVATVIEPHLRAWGDPGLLHAALENLLSNAWKYTGRQAQARIEVGHEVIDGETVYFVRDNGAGFDMRYADKLFGAFQRLHHPDEFAGTGVGLATVKRIVHRHGGRIWAEGTPDHGATFRFTLPQQQAGQA